jgi:hypothetical protein
MIWHVTGVRVDGRRFKIVTRSYHHAMMINLYRGSVWQVMGNGQRRLIKRVMN